LKKYTVVLVFDLILLLLLLLKNKRTYFKISLILAYIGGCLQLSLILGKYLTNYFNKISFYTSFVNEVF